MTEINNFDFKKYDVGGKGAIAGDGKLTGDEVKLAKADGWTVWEEMEAWQRPFTGKSIEALKKSVKTNNTSTENKNYLQASSSMELGEAMDNNLVSELSKKNGLKFVNSMLNIGILGKTLSKDVLELQGFLPVYMTDEKGASFYENMQGGKIRICDKEGEEATGKKGSKRVQYTGNTYEQDFIYGADGKIKKGTIILKDENGNLKDKYDFEIGADGKIIVAH